MKHYCKIFFLVLSLCSIISFPVALTAQTKDELQQKIEVKNKEIDVLEAEIAEYQKQIVATGKQATTLKGALQSLELVRKKLVADISVTEKKIDAVTLTIQTLQTQIEDKQDKIELQNQALESSIRAVANADQTSLFEALLLYEDMSTFWGIQAQEEELHGAINSKVRELATLKTDLTNTKTATETKKQEMVRLRAQLSDQKKIVEINKNDTNKLLTQTKNTEANYKKILAEREAKRAAFQKELSNYEAQLKLIVDPGSFPHPGTGVLAWPTDNPLVTQEFGDTEFSRTHPQAYNGNGHNGIDLRATPGTPIKAALSGVVSGVGDTDTVCPGASYGKWVLIKHANGLSTLYAHLSLIRVVPGQNVGTREVVGYGGSTGYATGPHLHFTVYATQGVQIISRQSRVCGGTYTLPVADLKAYLNPMTYL